MWRFLLAIFVAVFVTSCDETKKPEEEKPEDNFWSYQGEAFGEIQNPYVFVDYTWDGEVVTSKLMLVDLSTKEVVKELNFPFVADQPVQYNPKNGRFYFFDSKIERISDPFYDPPKDIDGEIGLIELDPKTGVYKRVITENSFNFGRVEAITPNGKVYLNTSKACSINDNYGNVVVIFDSTLRTHKEICVEGIADYLHLNMNGNVYAEVQDNLASAFEINSNTDDIKKIFSVQDKGGWTPVTFLDPNKLYFRYTGREIKYGSVRYDLKTGEMDEISLPLGNAVEDDFLDYLSSNGSFKVGKDLFIFTYNVNATDTHLVHYDEETEELKHLYSGVPSRFQTFYRGDNRTVEIRSGMIFFLDDFEIMQFNNPKNLFEIKKKF